MKKKRLLHRFSALSFTFVFLSAFAAEHTQVFLIPKEVYVGDEALIHFEFTFADDLFENTDANHPAFSKQPIEVLSCADYTVQKIDISGQVPRYTVSIYFIPWKTGSLDIAPFNLGDFSEIAVYPLIIDVPPVNIQSITEKTGEKNLRAVKAPLVVPGTTYIVFGFCALVLLFAGLLAAVVIRSAAIGAALHTFFAKIFSSRNYLNACRELLFLEKHGAQLNADIFCTRLALLIRTYLEKRFAYPFTAKTSGELMSAFYDFSAGSASKQSCGYMHKLYEVYARCDYIRFSRTTCGDFFGTEGHSLIKQTRSALIYFEQPEEEHKAAGIAAAQPEEA